MHVHEVALALQSIFFYIGVIESNQKLQIISGEQVFYIPLYNENKLGSIHQATCS